MSFNPNGPRSTTGTTFGAGTSGTTLPVETETEGLRMKAEHLASTVKDKAAQFGSTVSDKANSAITSMGEKMSDMGHSLGEKVPTSLAPYAEGLERAGQYLQRQDIGDFVDDLSGIIRRHPMPALLTGVAVGFLLARTARR